MISGRGPCLINEDDNISKISHLKFSIQKKNFFVQCAGPNVITINFAENESNGDVKTCTDEKKRKKRNIQWNKNIEDNVVWAMSCDFNENDLMNENVRGY